MSSLNTNLPSIRVLKELPFPDPITSHLQKYIGHYDFCLQNCEGPCQDNLGFLKKKDDTVELDTCSVFEDHALKTKEIYFYDMLISRNGNPRVAVEVFHTPGETPEMKIRTSRENGICVVEVKANDVLSVLPRLETKLLNGGSLTIDNLNEGCRNRAQGVHPHSRTILFFHIISARPSKQYKSVLFMPNKGLVILAFALTLRKVRTIRGCLGGLALMV
jgi:hypothetical protein